MFDPCDFCIYDFDSDLCGMCKYNPDLYSEFSGLPQFLLDSLSFAKDGSDGSSEQLFSDPPFGIPESIVPF